MKDPELVKRIQAILATMQVPLEYVDLANPMHVGRLVRELDAANPQHPDLDEVRGLLKQHRFVNLHSSDRPLVGLKRKSGSSQIS